MKPVVDFMLHWLGVLDDSITIDYVYNEDGMYWRVRLPQLDAQHPIPNDGYFFGETPTEAVERCWRYVHTSGRMKAVPNPLDRWVPGNLEQQAETLERFILEHNPVPAPLLVQALRSSFPDGGTATWSVFPNAHLWTDLHPQMVELLDYLLAECMVQFAYPTAVKYWPESWTLPLPQVKSWRPRKLHVPHWLPLDLVHFGYRDHRGDRDISKSFTKKKLGSVSHRIRYQILTRDGYRCQICGATAADGARLEVDHKQSRAKGGDHRMENLHTLCFSCNRGKYTDQVVEP